MNVRYTCDSGVRGPDQSFSYEVVLVQGEPYYQLIEEDGKPLTESRRREEDAKLARVSTERAAQKAQGRPSQAQAGRTRYRFERLAEFHDARLAGSRQWQGHNVLIVTTTPKRRIAARDDEERMLARSQTRLFIDAKTKVTLWGEVQMRETVGDWQKGTTVESEAQEIDGGWLPLVARSRRSVPKDIAKKLKCQTVEIEQLYSQFRKFEAESKFYPGDLVHEQ